MSRAHLAGALKALELGFAPEKDGPPPAVAAATMASMSNIVDIFIGAIVLVLMLVTLYVPSFTFNTLAFTWDSHSGWSGWLSSSIRDTNVS